MTLSAIQQMEQLYQAHDVFTGDDAKEKLLSSLARSMDEDATGGVFGYRWQAGSDGKGGRTLTPILVQLTCPGADFKEFTMVVVDAGNTAGDSWKYVYFPGRAVGIFVQENDFYPGEAPMPGRFDVSQPDFNKALVMEPGQAPLTRAQLKAITKNGVHRLCIAVSVPLDKLMSDIEALNDFVSEKITGSEADLSDLNFERFVPNEEEKLHDIKDNVYILVNAQWEPVDGMDDDTQDDAQPQG